MNNRKLASQTIRALHKENASGGGGGEVWENVDFTGGQLNDSTVNDGESIIMLAGDTANYGDKWLKITTKYVMSDAGGAFEATTQAVGRGGGIIQTVQFKDEGGFGALLFVFGVVDKTLGVYAQTGSEFSTDETIAITKIEMLKE